MKPKGVTTQMKALDEYILMILFVIIEKSAKSCDYKEMKALHITFGFSYILQQQKIKTRHTYNMHKSPPDRMLS